MRQSKAHSQTEIRSFLNRPAVLPSSIRRVACSKFDGTAAALEGLFRDNTLLIYLNKYEQLSSPQLSLEMKTYHPIEDGIKIVVTMHLRYAAMLLSFLASGALAVPLHDTDGLSLRTAIPAATLNVGLMSPPNAAVPPINVSAGNLFETQCDGSKYGFNPSLSDCQNAQDRIALDSEQQTFGERDTGLPDLTFPLPYIIMGGKSILNSRKTDYWYWTPDVSNHRQRPVLLSNN